MRMMNGIPLSSAVALGKATQRPRQADSANMVRKAQGPAPAQAFNALSLPLWQTWTGGMPLRMPRLAPTIDAMLPQMSTQQILMMVAANLLPLALLFSAIVLIIWARRRHAVKRAGVSADSPGCTRCLYLVRGWNSPMCPECGHDVRAAGVCIGPRAHLALKLIGAITM